MLTTTESDDHIDEGKWQPDEIVLARNNYFPGKLLTASDLSDEKRALVNVPQLDKRLFHGWGILFGIEVHHHPRESCEKDWVVIETGMAVDGYGRYLVVPERQAFQVKGELVDQGKPAVLCARYRAVGIDMVPGLVEDDTDPTGPTLPNRVRLDVEFVLVDPAKVKTCGTLAPEKGEPPTDKGHLISGPHGMRLKYQDGVVHLLSDIPRDGLVPLATVTKVAGKPVAIDPRCRIVVRNNGEPLTRICATNWNHAGTYPSHDVYVAQEPYEPISPEVTPTDANGKPVALPLFWVEFNQRLHPEHHGINAATFEVTYYADDQDVRRLRPYQNYPHYDPETRRACFVPCVEDFLKFGKCNPERLFITVHCDAVVDKRGRSVDGNFLCGGRFPTGDGVEGGTFRSWINFAPPAERST